MSQSKKSLRIFLFVSAFLSGFLILVTPVPTQAHDIYTGIRGKNGQICCGGSDCAVTTYRERADRYQFLTRERKWVEIPQERISFLPIPGDRPSDDSHLAHLCYREANDGDRGGSGAGNVFDDIYLYCAFIPPGSI